MEDRKDLSSISVLPLATAQPAGQHEDQYEDQYEAPKIEAYAEDDTWTFAPCGQD